MSRPEPAEGGSSRPYLFALLILACVLLGALLNWAIRERQARSALTSANLQIRQSYTLVLAKRNDLAAFLTDERTRLYRLTGHNEAAGRSLTIAWQEQTRTGILIADNMPLAPDGQAFAMWHLGSTRDLTFCGTFQSDPAGTYYDFRAPAATATAAGFLVSLESDAEPRPGAPGHVVYETR